MQGLHLTADLHRCRHAPLLRDAAALEALCRREVAASGLQAVNALFHRFAGQDGEAGGVTGVVLLAESHLALHTWPELAAVTLDVYVCNFSGDNRGAAERLLRALEAAFAPEHCERQRLERGTLKR
jgi:S-adenosylmethionine decarboxylase proenzyme